MRLFIGFGGGGSGEFRGGGDRDETDGWIVCPSSVNGIVGLKPTVGLVSRSGVIPISASQDTAGPMTRTVADAAMMLSAMTTVDRRDPATLENSSKARRDYETFLKADGLRGARIGVARDYWGKREAVDKVTNAALDVIRRAGAVLVDVKFPDLQKFGDAENLILQYEFKDGIEKYLSERNSRYRTLDDLIKFNKDNAAKEMPVFGQDVFEASAKRGDLSSKEYREALDTARKYARKEGIDKVMDDTSSNAVVAPSNGPVWAINLVSGDCGSGYVSSSSMPAVAGYPNITVPAGYVKEPPDRHLVLRPSLFGADTHQGRLFLRAGKQRETQTEVPPDGKMTRSVSNCSFVMS